MCTLIIDVAVPMWTSVRRQLVIQIRLVNIVKRLF